MADRFGYLRHEHGRRNRQDQARRVGTHARLFTGQQTPPVGGSEFVIYNSENGEKIRALKLLDNWNE